MALVLDFRHRDTAIGLPPREALRARLTQEIEERIAILDALDGDPDLEPGADAEPTLGWTRTWAVGNTHDLEEKDAG